MTFFITPYCVVPLAYSEPASLYARSSQVVWANGHFYFEFIVGAIAPSNWVLFLLQLGAPKSSLGHLIVGCTVQCKWPMDCHLRTSTLKQSLSFLSFINFVMPQCAGILFISVVPHFSLITQNLKTFKTYEQFSNLLV